MLLQETFDWYCEFKPNNLREQQINKLIGEIEDNFDFDEIICIETGASQDWKDGCIGAFFAKMCEETKGNFYSVDISKDMVENSKKLYQKIGLNNTHHFVQDSVEFLKSTEVIPNIVHLDSSDLNLKNPIPCAIHAWDEFCAIENKMPVGSLIIVDDNYFNGTWVNWKDQRDNEEWERITINYPIIGKGTIIYHRIESGKYNWEKISNDIIGINDKLVFKKVKE